MADKEEGLGTQRGTQFIKDVASKGKDVAALNTTMSSFALANVKAINSLAGQFKNFNQNILKLTKPAKEKKDFIRKEDSSIKLYKAVDDLEGLMKENNKLQKEKSKSKGILDWIGKIGSLVGIAGLVGYLLFGQNKYLKQAREMFKKVGGFIWDGLKFVGDLIWDKITDWWNSGGQELTTKTMEFIGQGLLNGIQKVWDWAKEHPKTAVMGGLLGALLTGNLGNLVGLSFGLAKLSVGTLTFLLSNPAVGLAMASVGAVIWAGMKAKEAVNAEKSVKKTSALMERSGEVLQAKRQKEQKWSSSDIAMDVIERQEQEDIRKKLTEPKHFAAGAAVETGLQSAGALFGPVGAIIGTGAGKIANKVITGGPSKKEREALTTRSAEISKSSGQRAKKYGTWTPTPIDMEDIQEMMREDQDLEGDESESNEKGDGWFTFKKWNPKLSGLKTKVWQKFQDMAKEYKEKSKGHKSIQINSAFRNENESMHGKGYAIDINSANANELENLGLMEKYGFHRPLLQSMGETWHVEPYSKDYQEPRNTNNLAFRQNITRNDAPMDVGGDNLNLPRSSIQSKYINQNNKGIDLSESTIQALAKAIGYSFKGAIPTPRANQISIDTSIRG